MSLVTLTSSPATASKKVVREARSLAKSAGSKDDIFDDISKFAGRCFSLRLTIFKFIEIDNLVHREMADCIAEGKTPNITREHWNTAVSEAVGLLAAVLSDKIKFWRKHHLDRMKKVLGLSLDQLLEAETAAKDFIDALQD